MHPTRLFSLVALLLLSGGCGTGPVSTAQAAPAEMQLRAYAVPAGYGAQVESLLSGVMPRTGDQSIARVHLSPDGRLVVVGPPGIQEGVRRFLAELQAAPPAAPPPAIRITYWIVTAKKSKTVSIPPELVEVKAALDAVVLASGPMEFSQYEKLSITSLADEHADTAGQNAHARQRASVSSGKVLADLSIDPTGPAKIETRVQLNPGQLLVLGEASTDLVSGPSRPETARLFYVARATVNDEPAP